MRQTQPASSRRTSASSITIPVAGTVNVAVAVQQPGAAVTLNGQTSIAVNGIAMFKGVVGPIVVTGKAGWVDVVGISIADAPATVYTVTVTAPGIQPQTFSASKLAVTLTDGTIKTIPEAA